jgi:hypothetical protein
MQLNPNGADSCNASFAADDKPYAVIGLVARLHAVDTLTPRLHEI